MQLYYIIYYLPSYRIKYNIYNRYLLPIVGPYFNKQPYLRDQIYATIILT